jgi:hypothetical protein
LSFLERNLSNKNSKSYLGILAIKSMPKLVAFSTPTTFDESMEIEIKVVEVAKAKEEE